MQVGSSNECGGVQVFLLRGTRQRLGKLDEAYRKWLLESSFKKYMGKSSARFLTLSPIREVEAKSVEDVLSGDFKALESLVYHVKLGVGSA